ncbi:hypothetical protein GOP47_0025436 [Adiantum capillus-veneris]|uniref:Uncharacterized protein n=1 Tax=Adiantum capillus-veneris TaxID=13818 RepID=A0A9D4U0R3_ADICA|nr:hypothetical protein GOP47_0025436 [Adiantum capillus-veneris]
MESENEISAASVPPAVCIDDGAVEVSNQVGKDGEKVPREVHDGHTKLPLVNLPDVEPKNVETGAKERIDIDAAEKKLVECEKEQLGEISFLEPKLQSAISIGENKIKVLESDGDRLVKELNASKNEVSDLKRHFRSAKQDYEELVSQEDALKETIGVLEKKVEDVNDQAKETKENFSKQFDACQAELATKVEALESFSKVHSSLQLELQDVKSKSQESVLLLKEHVFTLEGVLKSAQDNIKAKEAAALLLQTENTNLKLKISEHSTASEERQKQFEDQETLKDHEKRCEALEKSSAKLEGRNLELLNSLRAARSEVEVARGKVADLELEMESLQQMKSKSEQGASELQAQLRSMEDMISKQVDSLKIAEENADTAKLQVEHLQSMLKTTEEQLRASEEATVSLQQQVANLTIKEARSAEHLQEVEDSSQKIQLELQLKLETLEATVPQLEEKVAQLQDLLSAAKLDGDGARNKVSELEVELASLQHKEGELVKKVKLFEDKCSQQESTAHTLSVKVMELEGLITEFRSKSVVVNAKVATLEAGLVDSQNEVTNLEKQLRLAEDGSLLLENTRIAKLEKSSEEYVAKIDELNRVLSERQEEINRFTNKISELTLSIRTLESDLKSASEREMLVSKEQTSVEEKLVKLEALTLKLEAERSELESSMHQHKSSVEKGKIDLHGAFVLEKELRGMITNLQAGRSELQALLIRTEEEKHATTSQLESTMRTLNELNDQLAGERLQLQQQTTTIMQENEDLRKENAGAREKLHVALAAAEISAKQVEECSLKESILRDEVENLKFQLKKAHDACVNAETLEQEKVNLAQKFASAQEKLHAMVEAAELSASEASLKETTSNAEIRHLKIQLEQTLENSITSEEHQRQIDQILAASRLSESKLADLEGKLLKSKLEVQNTQNSVNDPETLVRELDPNKLKEMEAVEQQPSDCSKMREFDLDLQSPGRVRNRKKKGVTWETDTLLHQSQLDFGLRVRCILRWTCEAVLALSNDGFL